MATQRPQPPLMSIEKVTKERKILEKAIGNLQVHVTEANKRNDNLSLKLHSCNEEIKTLNENNVTLQENSKNLLEDLVKTMDLHCKASEELITVKESNGQYQNELTNLRDEFKRISEKLDVTSREIAIKDDNIEVYQNELINLRNKLLRVSEILDVTNNEVAIKTDRIEEITHKYESCVNELKSREIIAENYSKLKDENSVLKKQIKAFSNTQEDLKECLLSNKQLREENCKLIPELKEARDEISIALGQLEVNNAKVSTLESQLKAAKEKTNEFEVKCGENLQKHLLALQELETLKNQYRVLKTYFDASIVEVDALNRELAGSKKENEQLKEYVDVMTSGNLKKLDIIVKLCEKIRNGR